MLLLQFLVFMRVLNRLLSELGAKGVELSEERGEVGGAEGGQGGGGREETRGESEELGGFKVEEGELVSEGLVQGGQLG